SSPTRIRQSPGAAPAHGSPRRPGAADGRPAPASPRAASRAWTGAGAAIGPPRKRGGALTGTSAAASAGAAGRPAATAAGRMRRGGISGGRSGGVAPSFEGGASAVHPRPRFRGSVGGDPNAEQHEGRPSGHPEPAADAAVARGDRPGGKERRG